jgi:hypothetical protein
MSIMRFLFFGPGPHPFFTQGGPKSPSNNKIDLFLLINTPFWSLLIFWAPPPPFFNLRYATGSYVRVNTGDHYLLAVFVVYH